MSLFTEASLVMIPSGVKDGKLYSIKPDDGVGDFTFTRGSNLAATRVDENGLIEKGRENLLLQSNQFDTTLTNSNSIETSGQSGYDGSSDAWLITKNDAFGFIKQAISSSGTQTFSVYAKASDSDWIRLYVNGVGSLVYFDLSTGVVGGASSVIDSNIDSIGNGWYRCSIAFSGNTTEVYIYPAEENSVSATSGSIYIQDAQLELGLVATDYIETGATTEQAGILENLPRLDYTDSSCPSLLLEPTRSNLVTQSEYFGSSDWTKANLTATLSSATSPSGLINSYDLIENTTTSAHIMNQSAGGSGTSAYSFSVFAKNLSGTRYFQLWMGNGISGAIYSRFDLINGTVTQDVTLVGTGYTTGITSIEDYGNGWYRCTMTGSKTNTTGSNTVSIRISEISTGTETNSYLGNGTSGFIIYGAQLEVGSYPTSYIPTYGTSVTRSVDYATKTGVSDLIGQTEGSAFVEILKFNPQPVGNVGSILQIHDGSSSNRIGVIHLNNSTQLQFYIITGSVTQAIYSFTPSSGVNKIAFAYANNDVVVVHNGSVIYTDTSATIPVTSAIALNTYGYVNVHANDSINKAIIFKSRLSNTELIALTTI